MFLLSPITYGLVSLINENKRTDYRGKVEANKVLQLWQKDFKESIKLDYEGSYCSYSFYFLGLSKYFLKRYEEAIKDLDEAIIYDPKDSTSFFFSRN